MSIQFSCDCGRSLAAREQQAGKSVRCPRCGRGVNVPFPDDEEDQQEPIKSGPRKSRQSRSADNDSGAESSGAWLYRLPLFAALAWLPLGLDIALATPRLWRLPTFLAALVNYGVLAVTMVLIGWALATGLRLVGGTGRTIAAFPLSAVQVPLFLLLFFQIACHLGSTHYIWDSEPRPWDWLGLTTAHAIRAGDLLDVLEAYGVKIQTLQHGSALTSIALIVFHLVLDLFLISLIIDGAQRYLGVNRKRDDDEVPLILNAGWFIIFFLIAWLASALYFRPWRRIDLLIWPLDNLARVIDFADILEVFHVRVHQVPQTMWENTLTFTCRLLLGLALVKLLADAKQSISLRWLGGIGLNKEDLKDLRDRHSNKTIRQRAGERLQRIAASKKKHALPSQSGGWLPPYFAVPLIIWMVAWSLPAIFLVRWDGPVGTLAEAAVHGDPDDSRKAREMLVRLGPLAGSAAPRLAETLPSLTATQQHDLLRLLGQLGPAGVGPLVEQFRGAQEELALQALDALADSGPRSIPQILVGLDSPRRRVRQQSLKAIRSFGLEGAQPLIDNLTPENACQVMPLVAELDPKWGLRASGNPHFKTAQKARRFAEVIANLNSDSEETSPAANAVADLGPLAINAFPALANRWKNYTGGYGVNRKHMQKAIIAVTRYVSTEVLVRALLDCNPDRVPKNVHEMAQMSNENSIYDSQPDRSKASEISLTPYEDFLVRVACVRKAWGNLAEVLADGSDEDKASAERLLGAFGFYQLNIIQNLVSLVETKEGEARRRAIDAIVRFRGKPEAEKLRETLGTRINNADPAARAFLQEALDKLGIQ